MKRSVIQTQYDCAVSVFSGAVLAGGRSSRFGRDKARFVYRGKPFLHWVLDSLQEADERFIVANRDYPEFELPVYGDLHPEGGSLSGLHAALVQARHEWVALAACDMPFLTAAYWRYLLAHRTAAPVVIVGDPDTLEPLAALYRRSLLPLVERQLSRCEYALHRLIEQAGASLIHRDAVRQQFGPDVLRNINTLSDVPEETPEGSS
jgi:molybdopterin-guanine dinucleotide biosynthesis protein A